MWGRRWDGGMRLGAWQEPSAGPWRHGEMANVWQAASNAGSGERSKNFLIHQRTHLGLGQAPQRFSLCTCVCVGVGVRAPQMQKQLRKLCWQRATPQQQQEKQKQRRAASKKSKPNVENLSRGRGRRQEKELSSGAARVEAVVVVLMFFYRLLPSFLLSCFHCHVKSGKKSRTNAWEARKDAERECERETATR